MECPKHKLPYLDSVDKKEKKCPRCWGEEAARKVSGKLKLRLNL